MKILVEDVKQPIIIDSKKHPYGLVCLGTMQINSGKLVIYWDCSANDYYVEKEFLKYSARKGTTRLTATPYPVTNKIRKEFPVEVI